LVVIHSWFFFFLKPTLVGWRCNSFNYGWVQKQFGDLSRNCSSISRLSFVYLSSKVWIFWK
jgi:hypothetical protein